MSYIKKNRWIPISLVFVIVLVGLAVWQVSMLQKAHSSFSNYAAFRGCTQITSQSSTFGTCTLVNGQSIKLVQVNTRWYLDGDIPTCMIGIGSFCFVDRP